MAVWGDFEVDLDREIGRGGMSVVYEGRQISLKRPAAIKVLKPDLVQDDPRFVERFHREAQLIAKLVDPRIVQVFGAGEADGRFFYAMERVSGEDLSKRLRRGGRMPEAEVLRIAENVAEALAVAWKRRIVHRDIKPSNIIVTDEGDVKVMDFGLAKHLESKGEKTSLIMGTPKYISPEQAAGQECDVRTDIYSLGVVLYELTVGIAPFEADQVSLLMYKHIYQAPVPPKELRRDISIDLDAILLRCMEKMPEKRYQDPAELIADIRRRRGLPGDAGRPPAPRPKASPVRAFLVSLLGVVSLIALGVHWDGLFGLDEPRRPEKAAPIPAPPPSSKGDSRFEAMQARATEAFLAGRWAEAGRAYEEALARLDSEDLRRIPLERKVVEAAREMTRVEAVQAFERGDFDEARSRAEEALRAWPADERLGRILREATFREGVCEAETMERNRQWTMAREKYESLRNGAPEPSTVEAGLKFCGHLEAAMRALDENDPRSARIHLAGALSLDRGREVVEPLLAEADRRLAARAEEDRGRRVREIQGALARARHHAASGEWAESMRELQAVEDVAAGDSDFDALFAQARQALDAPPGMVYVPSGEFVMGAEDSGSESRPSHRVRTGAFYIDAREVTRGEYAAFLAGLRNHSSCHPQEPSRKEHTPLFWDLQSFDPASPVVGVDWFDAWAYAAFGDKRLPTEAEFEKAAGFDGVSGKTRDYPWGDRLHGREDVSPWGARGMGSGVLEWTADPFRSYPGGPDGSALFSPRFRSVRGGVALEEEARTQARVAYRRAVEPLNRQLKLGFRCAKDPK